MYYDSITILIISAHHFVKLRFSRPVTRPASRVAERIIIEILKYDHFKFQVFNTTYTTTLYIVSLKTKKSVKTK